MHLTSEVLDLGLTFDILLSIIVTFLTGSMQSIYTNFETFLLPSQSVWGVVGVTGSVSNAFTVYR